MIKFGRDRSMELRSYLCSIRAGASDSNRFGQLGDFADLDNAITMQQHCVASTPDDDPNKPTRLSKLGMSYAARFGRLGDLTDLENAIIMKQRAFALPPDVDPDKPGVISSCGAAESLVNGRL